MECHESADFPPPWLPDLSLCEEEAAKAASGEMFSYGTRSCFDIKPASSGRKGLELEPWKWWGEWPFKNDLRLKIRSQYLPKWKKEQPREYLQNWVERMTSKWINLLSAPKGPCKLGTSKNIPKTLANIQDWMLTKRLCDWPFSPLTSLEFIFVHILFCSCSRALCFKCMWLYIYIIDIYIYVYIIYMFVGVVFVQMHWWLRQD